MAFAQVRGVRLHYEVFGDSGPWFALTTGGRRGYDEFAPLARKIAAEGFRVLLHDRRNTGASDLVIEGSDGEEEIWADDLVALLQQLGATPAFIGGASAGARLSVLVYMRHPEVVRALLLMRVTSGEFAAGRLPEQYYGQFIKAAREGGMAAVCAHEQYQERIAANPQTRERLMSMDPARYIEVMTHWLAKFTSGPHSPMMGVEASVLRGIKVPTLVIPGNDKTHNSAGGKQIHATIPGAQLHLLPIPDLDVPLVAFTDWAPLEPEIAQACARFMKSH